MQEMVASASVANCNLDVTIVLVEKSCMEEPAGSTSNKRRCISVDLGQVKMKASRLRQCSTYFDTCMSERWAQSKVPSEMKFHLEVHSKVRYYKDCFSRMQFLFKPIKSVVFCIELVKVASQIGFQDVIDLGVKYLAAVLWSDEEEKLVRDFCGSHLVPVNSLTELIARLDDFPVSEEENLKKNLLFVRNLLSDYLQCAFPDLIEESSEADLVIKERCYSCRQKFEGAFHLIVTGSEPGVCASVVELALKLLKEASLTLLSKVKENYVCVGNPRYRRSNLPLTSLSIFRCLHKEARKANAAQTMAELILDDEQVSDILYDLHMGEEDYIVRKSVCKWTRMIYSIFQDVLEGTLFLDTSQRVALFNQWNWVLCNNILKIDEGDVADLTVRFLSTLPRQKQAEIWKALKFSDDGPSQETHTDWVLYIISGNTNCPSEEQKPSSGLTLNPKP